MKIQLNNNVWYAIMLWFVLWLTQSILISKGEFITYYLFKNIPLVVLQWVVVMINLKFLIPKFFKKEKIHLYIVLSGILVYFIFLLSFPLVDFALVFITSINLNLYQSFVFTTDFWSILSGSSFFSLALLCSTIYYLVKKNNEKEKLNDNLMNQLKSTGLSKIITIKEGNKIHKVVIDDILFVKGLKEYVVWHTNQKKIIALQSLSDIELAYENLGLVRIHKSYIVNLRRIDIYQSNTLRIKDYTLPIGRTHKKKVKNLVAQEELRYNMVVKKS